MCHEWEMRDEFVDHRDDLDSSDVGFVSRVLGSSAIWDLQSGICNPLRRVRFACFEIVGRRGWVRSSRFALADDGSASLQHPFLRSLAHPEHRRFDPTYLIIETFVGIGARGSRKSMA